jgi:tRNA nucleotidyltransferase (CCA-adding enzyme)
MLNRYNINAMPILEEGRLIGTVSRQIIDRALYHKLEDEPPLQPLK